MSEEFDGVPEVPEEGMVGEEPTDGEGTNEPQPQMVPAYQIDALRSTKDKEIAALRKQLEQKQEQAQTEQARAAAYEQYLQQMIEVDPEAAYAVERDVRLAFYEEQERIRQDAIQHQQALQQWEWQVRAMAQNQGINPQHPKLTQAIEQAKVTGDNMQVNAVLLDLASDIKAAQKQLQRQSAPPVLQPSEAEQQAAADRKAKLEQGEYATLPGGGQRANAARAGRADEIYAELKDLLPEYSKHKGRIKQLRKELASL